ncbi:rhomboid family intramembrane serine protease [Thermobrachium celere]|uniref:FIG056164: rhomboid family serine protease n=1 Tax=Thermobrachium celere DSM 8682 TaxID=941824 RepID=R7RT48_9CLOT|nr:rhomboid family intramembrane serine protease [Thermobrachium celere]GFR34577.1 rhomboid family intramembrane serine protease [Thermobrachium celere]CDF58430.1 FIG056164: rhomboid family serine protease [Thermobrachium celere DSM 8682]
MIPIRDINPSRKKPFITILLILINIAVFVFEVILPRNITSAFIQYFGFIPAELTRSIFYTDFNYLWINLLTIFTSMFLHGSLTHLISNMWALWLFGDNVEDRLGHFKFLLVYLLSGFIAALTHYIFNINSSIVTIGASGAIAGVMGIYFILYPFAKIETLFLVLWLPFFINVPAFIYIGLWFVSQISNGILTLFGPVFGFGIAWWAHIGGFLFGTYIGKRYKNRFYYRY